MCAWAVESVSLRELCLGTVDTVDIVVAAEYRQNGQQSSHLGWAENRARDREKSQGSA